MMASWSVEENIRRAHKSFFHYGSLDAFQGDLSHLSTRSIIETSVMPIFFGSENRYPREMGTPQFGDPGPHIPSDMGTPGPHITRDMGPWDPKNSGDMGISQ